ncbi:Rieske 2Fe-2S domain-containing protein [Mycobacterium sp. Aquia_213]|uniref:Rieske 2Fe-2S domain-containing protein n=1 Tax=Mycobacterium sp. Aquia_213 TaxID=2991728 RepID=UPI00226DFCAE|nr:Rieske 2Fe-2S domain-containing protein [Mycobacterium sp. Aquia_213]WAC94115.1 Rieske 2Fe-2S domain-containing protein [Mycobacterium sp. Aquia_213]
MASDEELGWTREWKIVAAIDDLWAGDVGEFYVDDLPILLVHLRNGELRAFAGNCPHAGFPLADGDIDGNVLTCSAHSWEFDLSTGSGLNPDNCRLECYQVRRDGDRIAVAVPQRGASHDVVDR